MESDGRNGASRSAAVVPAKEREIDRVPVSSRAHGRRSEPGLLLSLARGRTRFECLPSHTMGRRTNGERRTQRRVAIRRCRTCEGERDRSRSGELSGAREAIRAGSFAVPRARADAVRIPPKPYHGKLGRRTNGERRTRRRVAIRRCEGA